MTKEPITPPQNTTKPIAGNQTIDAALKLLTGYSGWIISRMMPVAINVLDTKIQGTLQKYIEETEKKSSVTAKQVANILRMSVSFLILALTAPRVLMTLLKTRKEMLSLPEDQIINFIEKALEKDLFNSSILSTEKITELTNKINREYLTPAIDQLEQKITALIEKNKDDLLKPSDKETLEKNKNDLLELEQKAAKLRLLKGLLDKSPQIYKSLTQKNAKAFFTNILKNVQNKEGDIYANMMESFINASFQVKDGKSAFTELEFNTIKETFKEFAMENYKDLQLLSNNALPNPEVFNKTLDIAFNLLDKSITAIGSNENSLDEVKKILLPPKKEKTEKSKKTKLLPKVPGIPKTLNALIEVLHTGDDFGRLLDNITLIPVVGDIVERFNLDRDMAYQLLLMMKDEQTREKLIKEYEGMETEYGKFDLSKAQNMIEIMNNFFINAKDQHKIDQEDYKRIYAPKIASMMFGVMRSLGLAALTRPYMKGDMLLYLEYAARDPKRMHSFIGLLDKYQKYMKDPKSVSMTEGLKNVSDLQNILWHEISSYFNSDQGAIQELENKGFSFAKDALMNVKGAIMGGIGSILPNFLGFLTAGATNNTDLAKASAQFIQNLRLAIEKGKPEGKVKISDIIAQTIQQTQNSMTLKPEQKSNIINHLKLGYFHNIKFTEPLDFTNVIFDRDIDFDCCQFDQKVDLSGCNLQEGKLRFHYPAFNGKVKLNLEELGNPSPTSNNQQLAFFGGLPQRKEVMKNLINNNKLEITGDMLSETAKNVVADLTKDQNGYTTLNITQIEKNMHSREDYKNYKKFLTHKQMYNINGKLLLDQLQHFILTTEGYRSRININRLAAQLITSPKALSEILVYKDSDIKLKQEFIDKILPESKPKEFLMLNPILTEFLNIYAPPIKHLDGYINKNNAVIGTHFYELRLQNFTNAMKRCEGEDLMLLFNKTAKNLNGKLTLNELTNLFHTIVDIINAGQFTGVKISDIMQEVIKDPSIAKDPRKLMELIIKHSEMDVNRPIFDLQFYQELVEKYHLHAEERDRIYKLYVEGTFTIEQITGLFDMAQNHDRISKESKAEINNSIAQYLSRNDILLDSTKIQDNYSTIRQTIFKEIESKVQEKQFGLMNMVRFIFSGYQSSQPAPSISFSNLELHNIFKPILNLNVMSMQGQLNNVSLQNNKEKLNTFFDQHNQALLEKNYSAISIMNFNMQLCGQTAVSDLINTKTELKQEDMQKLENEYFQLLQRNKERGL